MKKLLYRAVWIPLAVSCAHRGGVEAPRRPASLGPRVPWAPGSAGAPGTSPVVVDESASSEGRPVDPRQPHGGTPPLEGDRPPSSSGCTLRFDQVSIGSGYTVLNALQNSGVYGTVTGDWGADQQLLRPWFLPARPGTLGYQMAQYSPAWWRALQYVSGPQGNARGVLTYRDYILGARFASILVAMMATAKDPECVRQIRGYADQVLGDEAKELDALPWMMATQAVQDGKILERFREVESRRVDLQRQMRQQEALITSRERASQRERALLEMTIRSRYQQIRRDVAQLGPCRDSISMDFILGNDASVDDVIQTCLGRIQSRLGQRSEEEIRVMNQLEKIRSKGGLSEVPGSLEAALTARLGQIQEETRKLEGYESMLLRREPSSLTSHLEELDKLLNQQNQVTLELPWKQELERRDELRSQTEQLAPAWLTYAYFGKMIK